MKPLPICCLVLGVMSAFRLPAQTNNWPVVQPLHERRRFTGAGKDDSDTPFLAFIKDAKGVSAYRLECHNGNYEDASEINFSGDFQCVLFAVKGDRRTSWNLLAADTKDERSSDWFNRGRMLSSQLRGECAGYPEYESVRHFKLRGMFITLQFSNLEWAKLDNQGNPQLTKFTFDVSVVPDKSASTSAAAVLRGARPPSLVTEGLTKVPRSHILRKLTR